MFRTMPTKNAGLLIVLVMFACLMIGAAPAHAEETDILNGTYQGVPYRLTADYELIVGQEGQEYTVNCADLIKSISYFQGEESRMGVYRITFEGTFHESGSLRGMLEGFSDAHEIDVTGLDTSGVTDMSYMFCDCSNVTNGIDVSGFDTSNVTDMSYMFSGCGMFELDLSGFDTSRVTDMNHMLNCRNVTTLDLRSFDTRLVTSMRAMFQGCNHLESVDLSSFDTSNVTNMRFMFNKCYELKTLDLSNFDTSKVTEMQDMFQRCDTLAVLDLGGFDTAGVTNMEKMFNKCYKLRSLDLSGFDTGKVENMTDMFAVCDSLQVVALGEKSLFTADPPSHDWTRYKLLDGTPASEPAMTQLSKYDGRNPGWYLADYVEEISKARQVICGTDFKEYVGKSDFIGDTLIEADDPAGTSYTWTKVSGSGELSGGTVTDTDYYLLRAAQPGLVTIRFEAAYAGEVLRTVTRSYDIIEPYETYSLEFRSEDDGYLYPGSTVTLKIKTWADDDLGIPTEATPTPTRNDFTWSQSGRGEVEDVSTSEDGMSFRFKLVNPGNVTITFTSADGKWSGKEEFWINNPEAKNLPEIEITSGEWNWIRNSYNGGSFYFEFEDQKNHVKTVRAVSWDESVVIAEPLQAWGGDGLYEIEVPLTWLRPGTAKISIVDAVYGEELERVTLTTTQEMLRDLWERSVFFDSLEYGDTSLTVYAHEGDTVDFAFKSINQSKTVPASGKLKFSGIPVTKTGTKGKVTFHRSGDDYAVTQTVAVEDGEISLSIDRVKPSSTRVIVRLGRARKGDVIKVKVGKKTYTKKVKKNAKTFKFTQKISKQKKGTKIKATVLNKFKQVRDTVSIRVK